MAKASLSKTRFFLIFSFFLGILLFLFLQLGFLQLFKGSQYFSLAKSQWRAVIEMPPARGRILDRYGRDLALDVRLDSLYAVSREIKNKSRVAEALHRILQKNSSEILQRLGRDKLFVWVARKLPQVQADAVRRLKVEGLGFVKESLRVYPKGHTACHVVGFTDIDNNGLEGIELYANSLLEGVPGWRSVHRDAKQRELVSKEGGLVAPMDGYTVHLTLDEVIQSITENVLSETCRKYRASGGSIIVMNPKTGDVLAMAAYPAYDLNQARHASTDARRNRAITDVFEPGSVFKIFTLAAILENRAFTLDESFHCENGNWAVAGKILHDHRGHGVLNFRQVIEKSSNIGTVKGAMRLGGKKLYEGIRGFGFGEKTGVALLGEVNGIVPHPRSWSRSSIINIPIGQGVAVTPIQLCSAAAAVANDGWLMKPRIISHVTDAEGKVIQRFEPTAIRRAISKEASLQVRSVLEGVVSRGTGRKAAVPGFKAAGKTGTAQKVLPSGAYSHENFIASFVGFVPYDEPEIVVAVILDDPRPLYYGGEVAAPAFSKVASAVLAYWRMAQVSPWPVSPQAHTARVP